jgi:rSAM/selenodomain-associated transferase 1
MSTPRLLVIAKTPVPGRVKTRLCPPCTPRQAALIAAAALADTLSTVDETPAAGRVLVVEGDHPAPPGWDRLAQRGDGLGERLAHAFADSARPGTPSLLVGMDTPQLTPSLLRSMAAGLATADAVVGPADDGGWWGLALRDPAHARVLSTVAMSTSDTGTLTVGALARLGLTVILGPRLRDVDHADDALAVAQACPGSRFAAAVAEHLGAPAGHPFAATEVAR